METEKGTITEVGNVSIVHHLAANVYCITVWCTDNHSHKFFLSETEFEDLKEAINKKP